MRFPFLPVSDFAGVTRNFEWLQSLLEDLKKENGNRASEKGPPGSPGSENYMFTFFVGA